MQQINILIADDHKMFREGLVELLGKEAKMHIVGDVGDREGIMGILKAQPVDVLLMDIDMGETNGIQMTAEIKRDYPKIRVLALSMHGDKNYIVKMMEAGAIGYILKNAGKEEMINAIHTVANGNTYFSSQVSSKLLEHLTNPTAAHGKKPEGTPLTDREIEVLKLIAEEYSNPEIAEKLFISIRTVDTHRRNLLDKLGAKNTAGLVKYAIQKGLLG
ncbi:response regulator transcription factor [Reichenbachiella agarivorans]|uniref:Response regulator transcription factor n=1 Tax=Reichenbachiella agarivorans TaxID=2979464 RepID=A0ABY6CP78_9BACT|nr:response regulator transcription factor [Reichenbachiella agarivorans]UXP32326.1 response regulator transcription factor [Reichenbachiella agarivorans]